MPTTDTVVARASMAPQEALADYVMRKRATWRRTPGNPYASDSTYEMAVVLASNRRCWELVDRHGLRGSDGKLDGAAFKAVFETVLDGYRFTKVLPSQIDWQEVADEFAQEVAQETVQHVELPPAVAPQDEADGKSVRNVQAENAVRESGERQSMADILVGDLSLAGQPSHIKARPIDADALAILRLCTATTEGVFLPAGQLDRKRYETVNAVLVALGGKWDRALKGHRFEEDPRAVLAVAVDTGTYLSPKDFGYFPTPTEVGRRLLDAADLQPGMVVLEPSAGQGALADLAAEIVGKDNVHTIEMLESNRKVLMDKGYVVYGMDFLATKPQPTFDFVIMNPPFENMADVDHVTHALRFLRPGGKLVSIMSPSFTFRETAKAKAFRGLMDLAGEVVENVPAGAFRHSGTNISTVILSIDASLLPAEFLSEGDASFPDQTDSVRRGELPREGARA